jgi:hypothetical protein
MPLTAFVVGTEVGSAKFGTTILVRKPVADSISCPSELLSSQEHPGAEARGTLSGGKVTRSTLQSTTSGSAMDRLAGGQASASIRTSPSPCPALGPDAVKQPAHHGPTSPFRGRPPATPQLSRPRCSRFESGVGIFPWGSPVLRCSHHLLYSKNVSSGR